MTWLRHMRGCQSGAAALEFAIVSLFLVLVSLAVIDFGRGLYVRTHLSYAADKGARVVLTNGTVSQSTLESTIREAFTGPEPELLQVVIGSETINGTVYSTVTLEYPLTLRIPGFTSTEIDLNVARRIPVT